MLYRNIFRSLPSSKKLISISEIVRLCVTRITQFYCVVESWKLFMWKITGNLIGFFKASSETIWSKVGRRMQRALWEYRMGIGRWLWTSNPNHCHSPHQLPLIVSETCAKRENTSDTPRLQSFLKIGITMGSNKNPNFLEEIKRRRWISQFFN